MEVTIKVGGGRGVPTGGGCWEMPNKSLTPSDYKSKTKGCNQFRGFGRTLAEGLRCNHGETTKRIHIRRNIKTVPPPVGTPRPPPKGTLMITSIGDYVTCFLCTFMLFSLMLSFVGKLLKSGSGGGPLWQPAVATPSKGDLWWAPQRPLPVSTLPQKSTVK